MYKKFGIIIFALLVIAFAADSIRGAVGPQTLVDAPKNQWVVEKLFTHERCTTYRYYRPDSARIGGADRHYTHCQ